MHKMIIVKKTQPWIKLALIVLPIFWGLYIVGRFGVNVFFWDEWEYASSLDRFWTFGYLWEQHNEHRMLFPKIITGIVGYFTSWNSKAFMYTSQVFLIIYYYVAVKVLLGTNRIKDIDWKRTIEAFFLGICIYSTCQYENLLWGFQISWIMIVSLGMLSYYFFSLFMKNGDNRFLCGSMVVATVVSFSSFHGLTIWLGFLGYFVICLVKKSRIPLYSVGVVLGCWILCWALYFWQFTFLEMHRGYYMSDVTEAIRFFLSCISSTIWSFTISELGIIMGAILVLATAGWIVFFKAEGNDVNINLIGPMIMSLMSMAMISAGRSGGATSISSRYSTVSIMFVVCFMMVCFSVVNQMSEGDNMSIPESVFSFEGRFREITIKTLMVLSVILPIMVLLRNMECVSYAKETGESRARARVYAINYKMATMEQLSALVPLDESSFDSFIETMEYLDKNCLNVFSSEILHDYEASDVESALANLTLETVGETMITLDQINGSSPKEVNRMTNDSLGSISGWIQIDNTENRDCYLKIGNRMYILNWVDRPDVTEHFGRDDFCGFDGPIQLDRYEIGKEYEMSVVVINRRQKSYFEVNLNATAVFE